MSFYRLAGKQEFDVTTYNALRDKIQQADYDLRRLRDPLHLDLPAEYLDTKKSDNLDTDDLDTLT